MIKIENLSHQYLNRKEDAISKINLQIDKGECVVVMGSSGSGKSTLLKCINRLIKPTSGNIYINDKEILNCSINKAIKIRGNVGMIFQNFNLIGRETVLINVLNGRLKYNSTLNTIFGKFSKEDYDIARENIKTVGLEGFENEKVDNLSGGQKQRVGIARALSQKPEVILADEPISSLDPKLMEEIMTLLKDICVQKGITLITSLHFVELAKKYSSRIIGIRSGELVFDGNSEELTDEIINDIYGKVKNLNHYG